MYLRDISTFEGVLFVKFMLKFQNNLEFPRNHKTQNGWRTLHSVISHTSITLTCYGVALARLRHQVSHWGRQRPPQLVPVVGIGPVVCRAGGSLDILCVEFQSPCAVREPAKLQTCSFFGEGSLKTFSASSKSRRLWLLAVIF
jgi:hypothetical protein